MFLITCPYCGEREQSEFKAGGEAHIERPKQPTKLNDNEWAEYLFMRKNIKGVQLERWNHAHGCRKWFNAVRDTSTDEILKIYKLDENTPELKDFNNTLKTPSGEPEVGSGNFTVKK